LSLCKFRGSGVARQFFFICGFVDYWDWGGSGGGGRFVKCIASKLWT